MADKVDDSLIVTIAGAKLGLTARATVQLFTGGEDNGPKIFALTETGNGSLASLITAGERMNEAPDGHEIRQTAIETGEKLGLSAFETLALLGRLKNTEAGQTASNTAFGPAPVSTPKRLALRGQSDREDFQPARVVSIFTRSPV